MPTHNAKFASNNQHRPYDDYLSIPQLKKAQELRLNPTGVIHKVKQRRIGNEMVVQYPWDKLELGDMFFAPIGTKSITAMRVSFLKTAARRDIELCFLRMIDPATLRYNGERDQYGRSIPIGLDCLRVSVTAIGVNAAKRAAFEAGVIDKCPPVRQANRAQAVRKIKSKRIRASRVKLASLPPSRKNPFWADEPETLSTTSNHPANPLVPSTAYLDPIAPPSSDPSPEGGFFTHANMTREEKLAIILRNAGQ